MGRRIAAAQSQHAAGVAGDRDAVLVGEMERIARLVVWSIVTVAPVRSVSPDVTVTPESTATAAPPTVNVLVAPDGVTTGGAIVTLTLSAAELLFSEPSLATIESDRVVVFVLVVEKVTDCKAAWYWAGRRTAGQGQHAAGVAAA